MRVSFYSHSSVPAGAELAMTQVVKHCPANVTIEVVLGEEGPIAEQLRQSGVAVSVLGGTRHLHSRLTGQSKSAVLHSAVAAVGPLARLARHYRRTRPDFIIGNSLRASVQLAAIRPLLRAQFVWYARDMLSDDYLGRPLALIARTAAKFGPAAFIANSEATLKALPVGHRPTHVVYSPVDTVPWEPATTRRPYTVGIVGRIAEWKGQAVFLRAFAEAFRDDLSTRALVVGAPLFGEDDYFESLQRLVDELDLKTRVTFTGHVNDTPTLIARDLDALVHSSIIPEPFGQVVAQGLSTGLPVIAADAGGPRELITHGVDGLLYKPGDVQELATLMRMVRSDSTQSRVISQNARGKYALRFSPPEAAREIYRFLDVLGTGDVEQDRRGPLAREHE